MYCIFWGKKDIYVKLPFCLDLNSWWQRQKTGQYNFYVGPSVSDMGANDYTEEDHRKWEPSLLSEAYNNEVIGSINYSEIINLEVNSNIAVAKNIDGYWHKWVRKRN